MEQDVKAQHTAGPWFYGCDDEMCARGLAFVVGTKAAQNRGRIAHVLALYSDSNSRERSANARLIAAAPDLLEVAQEAAAMFRYYERLHMEKGTVDGDAKARRNAEMAQKCEAAIAKATGEQP